MSTISKCFFLSLLTSTFMACQTPTPETENEAAKIISETKGNEQQIEECYDHVIELVKIGISEKEAMIQVISYMPQCSTYFKDISVADSLTRTTEVDRLAKKFKESIGGSD